MNALADDPEFQKFLLGQIPAGDVQAAWQRYAIAKGLSMTFDQWLQAVPQNAGAMAFLRQLWQYDELAKSRKEKLVLKLVVADTISADPAKNLKTPITTDEIVSFYMSLNPQPSNNSLDGITKKPEK